MVRVQGFFLTAPIFSKTAIPAIIKIGLSAVFCMTLYGSIFSNATTIIPNSDIGLSAVILLELLIGAGLGFLVNLIFDAISTFGEMIGLQMGHGSEHIFNPGSSSATNSISGFYGTLSMLFFLLCGGLFNAALILKKSFQILPLASFNFDYSVLAENYIDIFGNIFTLALKLLLPMIALMFIVDIFVAMFSKILPQASMFFLLTPNKIVIFCLFAFLLINTLYLNLSDYFNDGIYDYLDKLFWISDSQALF